MDNQKFLELRNKYLDKSGPLDEKAIEIIKRLFGLDGVQEVSCDEAHRHSYPCHVYESAEAGIVDRLLIERRYYRSLLKGISEKSKLE